MDDGKAGYRTARMSNQRWLHALFFGLVYFVVGMVSSALSGAAASQQASTFWRLAAWVASAVIYATHIAYEHFRLHNSARSVALHVGIGVAVGAFGLAFAATVHAVWTAQYRPRYLIALVAWPAIT